jgi:hypothetical protein
MKKLLKWGGIAFIALIVIGVIASAGGGNKSNTNSSNNGGNTATNEKQAETVKEYGLNEVVQDGDLAFTVTNVTTAKSLGNSYTLKNAQGMFYVVTLKLENKGNKTATFDSSMAKVTDEQGREFERSIEGQTAKGMAQGNVDLFLQQIQPSLSVTGDVVFDLPADVKNPVLVVKGSFFGKGAKINLQ